MVDKPKGSERSFLLEVGDDIRPKEQELIKRVQEWAEEAAVKLYGTLGGPVGAEYEQEAINAFKEHVPLEGSRLGLKVDSAIVAHVTGHDRPAETPAVTHNHSSVPKQSR
jgi:hypothetical protein